MEESEPDEPPSRQQQRLPRLDVDHSEAPQQQKLSSSNITGATYSRNTPKFSEPRSQTALSKITRWLVHAKDLVFCSRINVLLIFVPVGIAVGFADLDAIVVFILNALAIIPLAVIISTSTERLAIRLGETLGALLNVTVGNTAELMIFFVALAKDQIHIVQASLLGSILANGLLVLGTASLCGSLRFGNQLRDRVSGRLSIAFLSVGVLVATLPVTLLWNSTESQSTEDILSLSRGISIALVVVYLLYVGLQMSLQSGNIDRAHAVARKDGNTYIALAEIETPLSPNPGDLGVESSPLPLQREEPSPDDVHQGFLSRWTALAMPNTRSEQMPTAPEMRISTPGNALSSANHPSMQFLSVPKRSANPVPQQGSPLSPPYEVVAPQDSWQQKRDRSPHPIAIQTSAAPRSPCSSLRESSDGSEPTFQATRSSIGDSTDRDSRSSFDTDCSVSRFNEPYAGDDIELGPLLPSTELEVDHDFRELQTPLPIAIVVLILATCVVSVSTELAVDAIPAIVDSWHISHVFLGFIVLPVVGNAAEHVTAAKLAMKNKMVLAKNVAVESSTQIVLLIAPAIVLIGWSRHRSMTLHFDPFEIGCVISAVVVLGAVICYGSTGWKQGTMLWSIYGAFAVASLFYRGR